ncbi:glycosyl hydrolase [Frondihabitans australicus]|uniref:glycosyl hydrolase n=1 Tax=Frondihabitans australicus TaxID=386892 RepID=UPI001475A26A|nr:glycosyl hydrolase [Frondihabitans australicus]
MNFWQFQQGGDLANWNKPVDVAVGAIDAGETWQAAASGAYDARWTTSLTLLKKLRSGTTATTYIRFAHEMNGNWYPWSVNASNYTYFDAAWKRYRALQQRIFPQAKLVFSLNRESIGTGMDWRKFFPGSYYVDVIGVDYYNQYPYVSSDTQWSSSLQDTDQWGAPKGLAQYLAYAKSQGLPLAIPEWSGDNEFGDSPAFVTDLLSYAKANGGDGAGQIAYDILFNVGGYNRDFQLYGPDAAMPKSSAAYKAFFTSGPATSPSAPKSSPAPSPSWLKAGTSMTPGSSLVSSNGKYRLAFQSDGNLVVYTSANKAIWQSKTAGKHGTRLSLQNDANLVLYRSTPSPVWYTRTSGRGAGSTLTMQSDGNLVLRNSAGRALWFTRR